MTATKKALLTAILLATTLSVTAQAETIDLSYLGVVTSGAQNNYGVTDITGSGTVSFMDGLTSVTSADLTGFSFTLTVVGASGTDTNTYAPSDLIDPPGFAATIDPTGLVTALSFTTDSGSGSYWFPGQQMTMDLVNGSSTGNFDVGEFSAGTLTATAEVPEPMSIMLMASGLVGLSRIRRKRA